MSLADTMPYASWTSRVYTRREQFVREHPDYADTARVLLAIRPDPGRESNCRRSGASDSTQHAGDTHRGIDAGV